MSFSADEFIRVIKACRLARVTELKVGEIEVKFEPGEAAQAKTRQTASLIVTETEMKQATDKVNVEENLADGVDRLDLLQIEDPSLYEQLILERELIDSDRREEIPQH
jgi:hypothetical protein